MSDFDKWLESVDDDLDKAPSKTPKPVEGPTTYPCISCNGTGAWGFYRDRECFACNGTGKRNMTSAEQEARKRGAQKGKVTRANNIALAQEAIEEQHPGMIAELRSYISWNEFAKSLVEQFDERGKLSDKQIGAAKRMIEKTKASRAAKQAEREAEEEAKATDVSAIHALFDAAKAKGLKKPFFKAEGFKISEAPAHGKNAGSLYIKEGSVYLGKVTNGIFKPGFDCTEEETKDVEEALVKIAADPFEAATRYGRETGQCAVCTRELTDPKSIEAGIGPVCREKWFG